MLLFTAADSIVGIVSLAASSQQFLSQHSDILCQSVQIHYSAEQPQFMSLELQHHRDRMATKTPTSTYALHASKVRSQLIQGVECRNQNAEASLIDVADVLIQLRLLQVWAGQSRLQHTDGALWRCLCIFA